MGEKNEITLRINTLIQEMFNGNNSEFSRIVGISEANIRNYLKGALPKADSLAKIYTALDVSCEWLLVGTGEMRKSSKMNLSEEPHFELQAIDSLDRIISNLAKINDQLTNDIEILREEKEKYREELFQIKKQIAAQKERA